MFGDQSETGAGRLLRRMTAVREIALGMATIQAVREGKGASRLLGWGVFVDIVDWLAALAGRGLPPGARVPFSVLPPGYAAIGAWLATKIRDS